MGEKMNLYLISQDVNQAYDTFDSAVVCAETEDMARMMRPGENQGRWEVWCEAKDVKVELIGISGDGIEAGVVLVSFNAG